MAITPRHLREENLTAKEIQDLRDYANERYPRFPRSFIGQTQARNKLREVEKLVREKYPERLEELGFETESKKTKTEREPEREVEEKLSEMLVEGSTGAYEKEDVKPKAKAKKSKKAKEEDVASNFFEEQEREFAAQRDAASGEFSVEEAMQKRQGEIDDEVRHQLIMQGNLTPEEVDEQLKDMVINKAKDELFEERDRQEEVYGPGSTHIYENPTDPSGRSNQVVRPWWQQGMDDQKEPGMSLEEYERLKESDEYQSSFDERDERALRGTPTGESSKKKPKKEPEPVGEEVFLSRLAKELGITDPEDRVSSAAFRKIKKRLKEQGTFRFGEFVRDEELAGAFESEREISRRMSHIPRRQQGYRNAEERINNLESKKRYLESVQNRYRHNPTASPIPYNSLAPALRDLNREYNLLNSKHRSRKNLTESAQDRRMEALAGQILAGVSFEDAEAIAEGRMPISSGPNHSGPGPIPPSKVDTQMRGGPDNSQKKSTSDSEDWTDKMPRKDPGEWARRNAEKQGSNDSKKPETEDSTDKKEEKSTRRPSQPEFFFDPDQWEDWGLGEGVYDVTPGGGF
tara:strand:- start:1462 stop:3183 length:1722 start_codon:yes stop_codon:yes gene_type:complete